MIVRLLRRKSAKTAPRLPDGIRVYAVGDIHGRADLLEMLIARIDAHIAAKPVTRPILVFVGDYVDRGRSSREVLDLLIKCDTAHEAVFLRGNHDDLMLKFLTSPELLREWQKIGGIETLMSYGLQPAMNPDSANQAEIANAFDGLLPQNHRRFLESLVPSFSCGGYFFVHAGVRPGVSLAEQKEEDLLWIRDEFLLHEEDFGRIVVHGHTPVREIDIRRNRINIDTGAYVTGRLSCIILEQDRIEAL